jgi:sigma-B regulation protein RsbU (phosphoserine phosphatase)
MRIRSKLLILLLAMALIPLLAVTLVVRQAAYRLGRKVGAASHHALVQREEQRLRLLVEGQAAVLGRERRIIELALQVQAREVARCLASEAPIGGRIYYSDDYDRGAYPTANLAKNKRYSQISSEGERTPMLLAFSDQVFTLATEIAGVPAAENVKKLGGMTDAYRALYREYADIFLWQYTGLESGAFGCYPGHGGYPRDYDHREREWYRRAKAKGELRWTRPYIDVSTHQPVLTASMPVHGAGGTFVGVTAIDVAVADVIDRSKLPRHRSSAALLVILAPRTGFDPSDPEDTDVSAVEIGALGLYTLARPVAGEDETHWKAPLKAVWTESEDRSEFRELIGDMTQGRSNIRKMQFEGRPALWAYGHVWKDIAYLLIILPYEDVVAEAVEAERAVLSLTHRYLQAVAVALAIACLVVIVAAFVGARTVTRPVRWLAEAARRIARGELDVRAEIKSRDELGELGESFDEMVPQLRDRMRIRQSLALAMEIQQNLLPQGPPDIEGLDVAGRSIYCDETGGDYYDFLDLSELDAQELAVAVGDVSGHGIPAALLMTSARALVRDRTQTAGDLAKLMQGVNRRLAVDTPPGQFMTLLYMVINGREGKIRWANAGHEPPILYDPSFDRIEQLTGAGVALGIGSEWQYEEYQRGPLSPGSVIAIGTDGIWETRDSRREFFGTDRFHEIIRTHADRSASEICEAVIDALSGFREGNPQADDVTLVVVKLLR